MPASTPATVLRRSASPGRHRSDPRQRQPRAGEIQYGTGADADLAGAAGAQRTVEELDAQRPVNDFTAGDENPNKQGADQPGSGQAERYGFSRMTRCSHARAV